MENTHQPTFNSNSFFAGFLTGLFIQWTNIVPILGAFVLGLSIRNIPEIIDLRSLPTNFSSLLSFVFSLKKQNSAPVSELLTSINEINEINEEINKKIPIKTIKKTD